MEKTELHDKIYDEFGDKIIKVARDYAEIKQNMKSTKSINQKKIDNVFEDSRNEFKKEVAFFLKDSRVTDMVNDLNKLNFLATIKVSACIKRVLNNALDMLRTKLGVDFVDVGLSFYLYYDLTIAIKEFQDSMIFVTEKLESFLENVRTDVNDGVK